MKDENSKKSLLKSVFSLDSVVHLCNNICLSIVNSTALTSGVDLFTTFAALTKSEMHGDRIIDGIDFSEVLLGKKKTRSGRCCLITSTKNCMRSGKDRGKHILLPMHLIRQ